MGFAPPFDALAFSRSVENSRVLKSWPVRLECLGLQPSLSSSTVTENAQGSI
jgi:hypothetical protein